jgi:histidinol-phosphate/aromatic aminotransferase/cobyric acid decarboxylase-like protein
MLKWYPHLGGGEPLRAEISKYAGVIPENLIVTNGSDDALILICQTFLKTDVRRKTVCFVLYFLRIQTICFL